MNKIQFGVGMALICTTGLFARGKSVAQEVRPYQIPTEATIVKKLEVDQFFKQTVTRLGKKFK